MVLADYPRRRYSGSGLQGTAGLWKTFRRVTLNIQKKTVRYVLIGDQVGWQLARGGSIYGRQANYPYVWGILGFVFALAFVRTDKVLHIRNLDVLGRLRRACRGRSHPRRHLPLRPHAQ